MRLQLSLCAGSAFFCIFFPPISKCRLFLVNPLPAPPPGQAPMGLHVAKPPLPPWGNEPRFGGTSEECAGQLGCKPCSLMAQVGGHPSHPMPPRSSAMKDDAGMSGERFAVSGGDLGCPIKSRIRLLPPAAQPQATMALGAATRCKSHQGREILPFIL